MTNNPDKRMAWVDLENFGLEHSTDMPFEVGITITNLNLNTIARHSVLIWSAEHDARYERLVTDATAGDRDAGIVYDMHQQSGAFGLAAARGMSLEAAQNQLVGFLAPFEFTGQDPMCGSSVQHDRENIRTWMPELYKRFHYRNVDVSTLKELCRRYNPAMFSHMEEDVWADSQKAHRVLQDLEDTIAEFSWYRDNFLFEDPNAFTI